MSMLRMFLWALLVCGLGLRAEVNLVKNGDFETGEMKHFRLARYRWSRETKRMTPTAPEELKGYRDTSFAHAGKASFCFEGKALDATNELNTPYYPCTPGDRCRLSFHYFYGAKQPRLTGRMMFFDANWKQVHYFNKTVGRSEDGVWLKAEQEFTVPAKAVHMYLTFMAGGQGKIYVDDVWLGKATVRKVVRPATARLVTQSPRFVLWQESGWHKVPRQGVPQAFVAEQDVCTVRLAQHETEELQLVVSPKQAMRQVTLRFQRFTQEKGGERLPENMFFYEPIGYVELKNPKDATLKGYHADPLLPAQPMDLAAGLNQPFLITVKTEKNTPAGTYRGTVEVLEQGRKVAELPLRVVVRPFALPEIPHLPTYFYFSLPYARRYDQRPTEVIVDEMYRLFKRLHLTGNQAEHALYPKPPVTIDGDKLTVTDWSKFDARVRKLRDDYGFRVFPVPYLGMMGDYFGWFARDRVSSQKKAPFGGGMILEDRSLELMGQYAKQFTDHVAKQFPGLTFYSYIYDEPPTRIRPEVKKLTEAIHRQAPDLKFFIPIEVTDSVGPIDTYCVPLSEVFVNHEKQEKKLAAGNQIWYYNWKVVLDDASYMQNRLYAWQIYSNKGSGGLLWNVMYSPEGFSPWTDFDHKGFSGGSATIFYPPRKPGETIRPSLRAIQIAQSIEDFSYLTELEKQLDASFPGRGRARVLEILRELIPDLKFDYVKDPALMDRLRNRLGDELERLARGQKALLLTNPQENAETELSEIEATLLAPKGTTVSWQKGKTATVPDSGTVTFPVPVPLDGENRLAFDLTFPDGSRQALSRRFIRRPDPNLLRLQEFQREFPQAETAKVLEQVKAATAYGGKLRDLVATTLQNHREEFLKREIAEVSAFRNSLSVLFCQRAKAMRAQKLLERAEYYTRLSRQTRVLDGMTSPEVRATATVWRSLPAVNLNNGILSATILECGGRIVSLTYGGVELLAQGGIRMPDALTRVKREVSERWKLEYNAAAGMEDADGCDCWPISYTDWDFDFRELKPDRVTLSAEVMLPGGIFRFRRTMTLAAKSDRLVLQYTIENVLPNTYVSDNPNHYELSWRARILPCIGGDRQDDELIVEGLPRVPASKVGAQRIKYEWPSIRLSQPFVGVLDGEKKTGLAIQFDPEVITHAYVWFDAWDRSREFYTLELPRSNYLQDRVKEKNKPFLIRPGRIQNFELVLRGVTASTVEEFKKKLKP